VTDYSQYEDKSVRADADANERLYMRQRRAINDAYAALQGHHTASTFAAFTFEEAIDQHIESVEGEATEAHPNKLTQVARIRGELLQAVEQLKEVPPEAFTDANLAQATNTPAEDDDFWGENESTA
jgi:hypothetical protein